MNSQSSAEALGEVARERLDAQPLGRVVTGRDEVDAELARGLQARLLRLAREEEVVALVRRLDQLAAGRTRADRDPLDPLRAVREDERLAADGLADPRVSSSMPDGSRRGRPGRPRRTVAPPRRRAPPRAGRCCRARDARRARGGTRAASGPLRTALPGGRAGAGRSRGSFRQNIPWWTITAGRPPLPLARRARARPRRRRRPCHLVGAQHLQPRASRTRGSGRPRAVVRVARRSRRVSHRARLSLPFPRSGCGAAW